MEFVKLVAPVYQNDTVDIIGTTLYRALVFLYLNYPIIAQLGAGSNIMLFDFINIINTLIGVSKTSEEKGKYAAMVKGVILISLLFFLPKIIIPMILDKWFKFSGKMSRVAISSIVLLILVIITTFINRYVVKKVSEKEKQA
jgi:hypothetical protein